MTILFRLQGAFGWFSYTTSRDTIVRSLLAPIMERHIAATFAPGDLRC